MPRDEEIGVSVWTQLLDVIQSLSGRRATEAIPLVKGHWAITAATLPSRAPATIT